MVGEEMNRIWLAAVPTVVFAAAVSLLGAYSGGFAAPTSGIGNAIGREKVNYYDVRGTTLSELRKDVFSRGPYDKTKGQRFAGWTEWRIQWWFDRRNVPQGCAVDKAATETQVDYTLPRWADADRASPELQDTWKRFVEALTLHEEGHGRLARALAERVEFAIQSLPPEPTCEELDRRVSEIANRMIAEDREQEEYDRRTGHGHTQGAAFPSILVRASNALSSRELESAR